MQHPILPRHLYGILGHPLGHSLSPLLHNWGFAHTDAPGLSFAPEAVCAHSASGSSPAGKTEGKTGDSQKAPPAGVYLPFEKTPAELAEFMRAVRALPIAGLSVTLPHKEAILPFLDVTTERANAAGAVNTVYWNKSALVGDNTDVEGFITPLRGEALPSVLILGAGGVARAALAGLAELHREQAAKTALAAGHGLSHVAVAARSPHKAAALAEHFGCRVLAWEERLAYLHAAQPGLVVNATPLGMYGSRVQESPLPQEAWAALPPACLAYDTVYNPTVTRFLTEARAHGLRTQDGLTLFIAQGLAQFRLWTGRALPQEAARALIAAALRDTLP